MPYNLVKGCCVVNTTQTLKACNTGATFQRVKDSSEMDLTPTPRSYGGIYQVHHYRIYDACKKITQ